MCSCGPAHQIRCRQIDLLLALLGELQLLHVVVPTGQVEVSLLVQVGEVFLKEEVKVELHNVNRLVL